MLISSVEKDGFIIDKYLNGTIVKYIKSDKDSYNKDDKEPPINERILANTDFLVMMNSF